MSLKRTYCDIDDLIDRLRNVTVRREKTVTFLIGSPLTAPDHAGGHGVPDVLGMIELIRRELDDRVAEVELNSRLDSSTDNRYQRAFEFLNGRRGPDAVGRVVRTAVWSALDPQRWPADLPETSPENASLDICRALEKDEDAWVLPRSADLFGELIVSCSDTFGGSVLTTNFDPLIEVSISKHGGTFYRTVLHTDGDLGQTVGQGTHIVHLHGYWYGYDSLHTPEQLLQERPQLKRSLERVIENSVLVVLGYGGWDDVITQALADILSDSTSNPEVMWAFHDENPDVADLSTERVLRTLEPGLGRGRVSLYAGIDCYSALAAALDRVRPLYPSVSERDGDSTMTTVVTEEVDGRQRRTVRIEVDFPISSEISSESDSPLIVSPWIGREPELSLLTASSAPIAFLTGIGGQGKSALAGQFLKCQAMSQGGRFDFWDWRDCREERDRLATQLLRLIERLSGGEIETSEIEVGDIRSIVGVLFQVLRQRKALLVFDNVDQYVDLETGDPIRGLDVLISESEVRTHQSCFLFTCRPDVRVDESRGIRIELSGLTESETRDLIAARGSLAKESPLAGELHEATDGHPMWISLIVMQALQRSDGLRGALDLIKQGGATLPETTRNIWRTLNKQQQDVLRTMAELDRPEPWNHLLSMLPGVNANRVDRALRFLRNIHLVEMRTQAGGDPLVGLHPIIREFVRTTFAKQEREPYVGKILDFLDRMIGRFRSILSQDPSYEVLEHWMRKAEYQITFGHFDRATDTIAEISRPLTNRGYAEAMIRLTLRLLGECDWTEACTSYRRFDWVFERCLTHMVEMGHDEVDGILRRYEDAISHKSAQFILLCDLRCYSLWYVEEFDEAIRWGEEGEKLRERTTVDTSFSTKHNLALARRDSGKISEALDSFLQGEALHRVTEPGVLVEGRHASFYGNIGRCLFLQGRVEEALPCYVKSAQLLEEEGGHGARLSKGYIRFWIAELLVEMEGFELAAAAYGAGMCMWGEVSPPRAGKAEKRLKELVDGRSYLGDYRDAQEWAMEGMFGRWLDEQ